MTRVGSKSLILAASLAALLLCLFDTSQASTFDCCLQYTEHSISSKLIKGYAEQRSYEACDIDAIIFYTRRYSVCADPKEPWVKRTLKILSKRLKKMSK
ncbi:C-C motif chemokine 20 isoform X2 [Dromiciops gliroides]|uniref:C-C motif chemokine 20 isoform X2 n=1 Tax=Dromiciops gliroides TaxID=33562 RepID=UPI001CC4E913|nr:C-C motif chemokine 20 isoform X2 [Dromiciops gliroides]